MLLLRDAFGLNRLDRSCPFTEQQQVGERVFSDRELTVAKAAESLRLLTEGVSIRSICRILHLGQHTVLNLLLRVGEGCERLQRSFVRAVPVSSVQCDELWSYVFCKERCKKAREYRHPEVGDCYVWTAIDPTSKLLLAYALGKRDSETGGEFIRKLRYATSGNFQIDTDGLIHYKGLIPTQFGWNWPHAQIIKIFGKPAEGEARYSPPAIIGIRHEAGGGNPDLQAASTSLVERHNLTFRMMLRRFTRLTNAYSKSWDHHRAATALFILVYNFVRPHQTLTERANGLKTTPAMASGLATRQWTMEELIQSAIPSDSKAVA